MKIASSNFELETLFKYFPSNFRFRLCRSGVFRIIWMVMTSPIESSWRPQFTSIHGRLFTQSEGEFCLFEASKRRNRVLLESTTGYLFKREDQNCDQNCEIVKITPSKIQNRIYQRDKHNRREPWKNFYFYRHLYLHILVRFAPFL